MAIPQYNLDEWFAVPRHDNGQDEAINAILADAKKFAETVNRLIPDGQEKQQAIEFIRQAVLVGELAIRWKWPAGKLSIV